MDRYENVHLFVRSIFLYKTTVQPSARIRCATSRFGGSPNDNIYQYKRICKHFLCIGICYRMAELYKKN